MTDDLATAPIELWGGVECTVNRVRDRVFDQLVATGHDRRPADLDRIAALGIRTLRYPVLWERTAPAGLPRAEWGWLDDRLGRLREHGIAPVLGLVHHGSGPLDTSLVHDSFGEGLEAFAAAVAERYPWVQDWTPVNEPVTTARFSGLYGVWYPHMRGTDAFLRALLVQLRASVRAMRAIRRHIPGARLVQTEDASHTRATASLAYQGRLENERRWLGFDLLCGRVDQLARPGLPRGDGRRCRLGRAAPGRVAHVRVECTAPCPDAARQRRGDLMPGLDDALVRYVREREVPVEDDRLRPAAGAARLTG